MKLWTAPWLGVGRLQMETKGKKLSETKCPFVGSVLETKRGEGFGKKGGRRGPGPTLHVVTGCLAPESQPTGAEASGLRHVLAC